MSIYSKTPTIARGRPAVISDVGSVPSAATGVVAYEIGGDGVQRQTLFIFKEAPVTVANTTGASFGSLKFYTCPLGRIAIDGCTAKFDTITFGSTIASGGSGDYSIGSTATSDATLSGTEVNILPSSAMVDPFTVRTGSSAAGTALAAVTQLDGTSTAVDFYLNVIIDDADVSDGGSDTAAFSGALLVTWKNLGAYQTTLLA